MNLTFFALRRPWTVMVAIAAIALGCWLAVRRMEVDIFPSLNLPVIYVCQPYGGMDPAQMEGLLTNYYEYHFLYISGIHHVESQNIQSLALMKLYFHPGTNMAQAMAETISYVNRARAFMPPGTVSPFVMRFDTGSVPVGYLVLSSETRSLGEIQDLALFRVRPKFASLPGVSAPPPFGGSARTVVIDVDPDKLRSYHLSPDDVISALAAGNTISPSGNVHFEDKYPIVRTNSIAPKIEDFGDIPLKPGANVFLREIATIRDDFDLTTGYALMNGRRAIYILVTKRADASTLSVVDRVKAAIPSMQALLPDDIHVSFQFDQSPFVTRAIRNLALEGLLGAALTGLMVLVFLRDWRSALVVVLNIPLALMSAVVGLWITGNTINLMTLSGLALAIGILVDEATVEVENIHTQRQRFDSPAVAVRMGAMVTAVPRFLAMLCILAVFLPSLFMEGASRSMFVPLTLAVGFSMISSYFLSSTFVPVLSLWLLGKQPPHPAAQQGRTLFDRFSVGYRRMLDPLVRFRWPVVGGYFGICAVLVFFIYGRLGREIFPVVDTGDFRIRLRAADGTHIDQTEKIALDVLKLIETRAGAQNIDVTLGYVGTIPTSYPINAVYQWSRGPEEAILRVALKPDSGIRVEDLKRELRAEIKTVYPKLRVSFEPSDIVNEVMSFGSPTPVEIAVNGPKMADNRAYADKVYAQLEAIPTLADLQIAQSLNYPTIDVKLDREKAAFGHVSATDVARSTLAATSSSRFVVPNYWPDPNSGIGYQVQVQIPMAKMQSSADLESLPIKSNTDKSLLLRDVADVKPGTMPGEYDRYNMRRQVSMTANIMGADLGSVSQQVSAALKQAGDPPLGVTVDVRGQIPPLQQMLAGLATGLGLAIVVIFLLLTANYQSVRLSLITVSTAPAVIAGVLLALWITRTTLNIQSFIGAIMAVGVAMANGILLVTFAEKARLAGASAREAALQGAAGRLRPILMTSLAMLAGMIPLAIGHGEGGEQVAPLGRAVIGGLVAATFATLLFLPSIFTIVQGWAGRHSASLDPDDPGSRYYVDPSQAKPSGGAVGDL